MKFMPPTSTSSDEDSRLVEVMDRRCQILAAMPISEVYRQQLLHRSVVILLYDDAGRLLLCKRPGLRGLGPERWDLPVHSPVFSGESLQDAATRTLNASLGIHAERMRLVQILPPGLENANEFLHVFTLIRPEGSAQHSQQDESSSYYFSSEELGCLLKDFSDLVSARFLMLAKAIRLTTLARRPL
ncbi:MAG: NUDIX domain-containing protein [Proteobacteria bacterium]|nr:NUDIX domain-containing protein [Pseudomonadota bacterium]MBU1594583.1 NUDIX domain-containing protein [Pseudomonadota bacterium]